MSCTPSSRCPVHLALYRHPPTLVLLYLRFCSHNHELTSTPIRISTQSQLSFFRPPGSVRFHLCLLLLALYHNPPTFRPPLSALLLSDSRVDINLNYNRLSYPLRSASLSKSPSSRSLVLLAVHQHPPTLYPPLSSVELTKSRIRIYLSHSPFLLIPISPTFNPQVLLAFYWASCPFSFTSQFNLVSSFFVCSSTLTIMHWHQSLSLSLPADSYLYIFRRLCPARLLVGVFTFWLYITLHPHLAVCCLLFCSHKHPSTSNSISVDSHLLFSWPLCPSCASSRRWLILLSFKQKYNHVWSSIVGSLHPQSYIDIKLNISPSSTYWPPSCSTSRSFVLFDI